TVVFSPELQAISGEKKKRRAPAEKTSGVGFSWLIGVDRRWVSVENKAAEGHRGSGSVSAKEKTTSQARAPEVIFRWSYRRFRRRRGSGGIVLCWFVFGKV
ncbi:hypothetical protein U1Q18_015622, partial [Sarracenia purpurea var. burkii]